MKPLMSSYIKMPLAELTTPKEGRICIVNSWWAITEDDCALFYRQHSSPQCNTDKRIAERVGYEGTRPVFVPAAFVPHRCEEYSP